MLTPHPRSFLFFFTECLRVEQEEEDAIPTWGRLHAVPISDLTEHEAGVLTRHAQRSQSQTEFARQLAETELVDLLGGMDVDRIPGRLIDRFASLMDHCLRQDARVASIRRQSKETEKRRGEETSARLALRSRVVLGLVGIYVGPGRGDLEATATLARGGVPTAVEDGKAQPWHVRDALKAYLRPIGSTNSSVTDVRVRALAVQAFLQLRIVSKAWARLKAEPGYKPSRHVDLVAVAASSGALAQWVLEAGQEASAIDDREAVRHLCIALIKQQHDALRQEASRRGLYVPPLKKPRRNAAAKTAS
ncbi:hypothetical protein [Aureimonas phyllosphaerae]|uniref:Uncharacterized protein n=1 Tax=Aureimonas phyllosphaerae TaxID=1166078 RepID=A0A7W6BUB3_9HYPH|nr:hypothetical protein [Aureimonas phyllosphaerae]MBB3938164.1 hypothetical protein [Aureimonas phyllosphaerae]MBB3962172.1 hypothetical protein [Aureimonas phyllosphaerae]SFF56555.1 hypothetical protein SAMN05216566_1308 [Aureimonas phyllosphaerae]